MSTIQIYTGEGKGKTTAALGAALRALGHGWKVFFLQFMKGSEDYGELKAAALLPGLEIVQKGLPTFVQRGNPSEEDCRLAAEGLVLARKAIASGEYQMVILDEANVAMDYGLLDVKEMTEMLLGRPNDVEVILTGRGASPEMIEIADTVTRMQEIKHHFQKGVLAREGIEY